MADRPLMKQFLVSRPLMTLIAFMVTSDAPDCLYCTIIMVDVPSVRIIHGKGTGVLREEIQKYLRTVPGVASAGDEDIQLGGSGVTVVRFE